jgi:phage baseplate assembly protein V
MEQPESPCVGRFGYVSAYDAKRRMARVRFPDKDNLVSAWLPVSTPNTRKNKDEAHLDVNEHVFCVMLGNGLEAGIVLGAIYDDKNKPPLGDPDVRRTEFEDGAVLSVDRKNHMVEIKDSFGSVIRMADGNIYLRPAKKVIVEKGGL